jgi:hypothetical protein
MPMSSIVQSTWNTGRQNGFSAGAKYFCNETGLTTTFGKRFGVFKDTSNVCAFARIVLGTTNVVCAATGFATPVYATNLNTAHDLLDAVDVWSTAHLVATSEKFEEDRVKRNGKHWGIKLLGISGACSFLSFADTMGLLSLSGIACKIGSFARLPKGLVPIPFMFAFSAFANLCAFAGFLKLYIDKSASDNRKTKGSPECIRERTLKLRQYKFKAIATGLVLAADIATFGLASTSLELVKTGFKVASFAGKFAGVIGDVVKIQHAMFREVNLNAIKA